MDTMNVLPDQTLLLGNGYVRVGDDWFELVDHNYNETQTVKSDPIPRDSILYRNLCQYDCRKKL